VAAQPLGAAAASQPAESPEQAIQRELAQQETILTDPASRPEQRDQAAERLVQRQREDARQILLAVLNGVDVQARNAVARALSRDPNPDPRFVQPLLGMLDPDPTTTAAAVSALTRYGDDRSALDGLIAFAGNAQRPPRARVAAVRGIGAFVKRNAAAFLISVIRNPGEEAAVRSAAFEALRDMTGFEQIGPDVQQWTNWWNGVANQAELQFESDLNRRRAQQVAALKVENQRLSERLKKQLKETYQRVPEGAARTEMVLGWLKDGEAAVRTLAASIVWEQKVDAEQIAPAVVEQLRKMIGDSSMEVRYQVIITLKEINDPDSIDPLLAQLAVETDPDVKIAIAQMLGRLQNLKALDALRALLNDPSARVVESAAEALRDMGEQIRAKPDLRAMVSNTLQMKLAAIANQPGSDSLRAALLEGLAPLGDRATLNLFLRALDVNDPRNAVKVRIAACRGLANLTEPDVKEQAATALVGTMRTEADAAVRLQAVLGLKTVGSWAETEALYAQMGPRETDQSVRDAAWSVLAGEAKKENGLLFGPDASLAALKNTWPDRFGKDPEKKLVVYQAARKKLLPAANDPQTAMTLAVVDQNIGEAQASLERWDQAVASFRNSFAYWQKHNNPAALSALTSQLLTALLRAGNYADATQFATERMTADPQVQRDIAFRFRAEVERLMAAKDKKAAEQLIDEIEKMQPPLPSPYIDAIRHYREQLKQLPPAPPP
jgi:HEAT repeat protein